MDDKLIKLCLHGVLRHPGHKFSRKKNAPLGVPPSQQDFVVLDMPFFVIVGGLIPEFKPMVTAGNLM